MPEIKFKFRLLKSALRVETLNHLSAMFVFYSHCMPDNALFTSGMFIDDDYLFLSAYCYSFVSKKRVHIMYTAYLADNYSNCHINDLEKIFN